MQIIKKQKQQCNNTLFQPNENKKKYSNYSNYISPHDKLSETQKRVFPTRYLYAYDKTYSSTSKESYIQPTMNKIYSPNSSPSHSPKSSPYHSPISSPRITQKKSITNSCSNLFTVD